LQLQARRAIGRVSERIHFVLLSAQGYSPAEIGNLMGYNVASIRTWLSTYRDGDVAALDDAPRSGRPRKEKHIDDVVEAQVGQPPTVFGYLQAIWTVAMLAQHLTRFGIQVSASTVRRALNRMRFSWHRPKFSPARRPDPKRAEKMARLAQVLKDFTAHIVAVDECDFHLMPPLRAMWQRIGHQERLPTPGKNAKRPVFGGLDIRTGQWFYRLTDHKRTTDFIDFLTSLLAAYPLGIIYIIADNASIHTSKALLKWLANNTRLQMVPLPTYSGHLLNPVEKIWWLFKSYIAANRCVRSLEQLDTFAGRWLMQLAPANLLRLTNCYLTRLAALPEASNV
jgi:transposase